MRQQVGGVPNELLGMPFWAVDWENKSVDLVFKLVDWFFGRWNGKANCWIREKSWWNGKKVGGMAKKICGVGKKFGGMGFEVGGVDKKNDGVFLTGKRWI